jgi:hypothetical protein
MIRALMAACVVGPFVSETAMSAEPADRAAIRMRALQLADNGDAFQAFALLEQTDDAAAVAEDYSTLVREIYGQQKHVPRMIAFGHAGIHFCLTEAKRCEADDPKLAAQLRGQAKTIAYNLGANTWPGWNDDGITLTATDRALGCDAARLNLRLGMELGRGPEPMAHAHWLVGAHALAAQDAPAAQASFMRAEQEFARAAKPDFVLMARGYRALALKSAAATRADGDRQLQQALKELADSNSDDAKFFAEQLRTAERIILLSASRTSSSATCLP